MMVLVQELVLFVVCMVKSFVMLMRRMMGFGGHLSSLLFKSVVVLFELFYKLQSCWAILLNVLVLDDGVRSRSHWGFWHLGPLGLHDLLGLLRLLGLLGLLSFTALVSKSTFFFSELVGHFPLRFRFIRLAGLVRLVFFRLLLLLLLLVFLEFTHSVHLNEPIVLSEEAL